MFPNAQSCRMDIVEVFAIHLSAAWSELMHCLWKFKSSFSVLLKNFFILYFTFISSGNAYDVPDVLFLLRMVSLEIRDFKLKTLMLTINFKVNVLYFLIKCLSLKTATLQNKVSLML